MDRRSYNTLEGIKTSLQSLESFHSMLNERERIRDKEGSLNEFVVLGRYWLDEFGQTNIARGKTPKDLYPDLPDTIEYQKFLAYGASRTPNTEGGYIQWSIGAGSQAIAPNNIPCAICGQFWSIRNCHDVRPENQDVFFPVNGFIGESISDLIHDLKTRRDAEYRLLRGRAVIRNDKFISRSTGESGWLQLEQVGTEHIIENSDEILVNRTAYLHPLCHRNSFARSTETEFGILFSQAGFKSLDFQQIPNEYGSESYRGPWFMVRTEVGRIQIGWRKRVIDIDWSATGRDLLHLFGDSKNTKSPINIHAWNYSQAVDYLTRIRIEFEKTTLVPA